MNLPFNFDKAIDGLTKVKLPGGVVGRVTLAVSVVSICLAAVAVMMRSEYLSIGVVAAIFILAIVMLWRLINFADRNPQAALLEGAEFIMHEQIVHASKTQHILPPESKIPSLPDSVDSGVVGVENPLMPDQEENEKTLSEEKE